jgi:branched-chain amino acid transport system permease protein
LRAASVVVLVAIVLPFLLGQFWAYQLGLYALYAAAAVGVGLCWGQAGFLPLGQALFFGLAAYLSGLAFIAFADSPILAVLALPLAALISGLLAYAIGFVVFRRSGESGAYFSMITLALALLAFQIATSWNSVTGGFNGSVRMRQTAAGNRVRSNTKASCLCGRRAAAGGWLVPSR